MTAGAASGGGDCTNWIASSTSCSAVCRRRHQERWQKGARRRQGMTVRGATLRVCVCVCDFKNPTAQLRRWRGCRHHPAVCPVELGSVRAAPFDERLGWHAPQVRVLGDHLTRAARLAAARSSSSPRLMPSLSRAAEPARTTASLPVLRLVQKRRRARPPRVVAPLVVQQHRSPTRSGARGAAGLEPQRDGGARCCWRDASLQQEGVVDPASAISTTSRGGVCLKDQRHPLAQRELRWPRTLRAT